MRSSRLSRRIAGQVLALDEADEPAPVEARHQHEIDRAMIEAERFGQRTHLGREADGGIPGTREVRAAGLLAQAVSCLATAPDGACGFRRSHAAGEVEDEAQLQ